MTINDLFNLALSELTPRRKVYLVLAAGAVVVVCLSLGSAWSHFSISRLEQDVRAAKEQAANKQQQSEAREREADKYRREAERLEGALAEIQKIARKQDEELEKISRTTDSARSRADNARGVRSLASTGADLCRRLEELGHGCN